MRRSYSLIKNFNPMASPAPRPITAITFDLGNVLIRVDHLRFCRRLGVLANLPPQEVYARVFESGLEPGYDTGRISSREFYQRVTAHFGVALPYSRFCDLWCDLFDPMEGMAEVVEHLASSFPLLLLSNTNALHFDYIQERFKVILRAFPGLRPVLPGGQPQAGAGHLPIPHPAGGAAPGGNPLFR